MALQVRKIMTQKQAAAWISEGPSHGVHINSLVLNDLCRSLIAALDEIDRLKAQPETNEQAA